MKNAKIIHTTISRIFYERNSTALKLKVFTFNFSDNVQGFDDKQMQTFIENKEIIEYTQHFFVHEKMPYLTVIIAYRDISQSYGSKKNNTAQEQLKMLDPNEKKIYEALRVWRAAKAKEQGIPPYMIAHNKNLADMIKLKVGSKNDLTKVKGFGESKINGYGDDILKIIEKHFIASDKEEKNNGKEEKNVEMKKEKS